MKKKNFKRFTTEDYHELIQDEIFYDIRLPYGTVEAYTEHSFHFESELCEDFLIDLIELLRDTGHDIAIFKKAYNKYSEIACDIYYITFALKCFKKDFNEAKEDYLKLAEEDFLIYLGDEDYLKELKTT